MGYLRIKQGHGLLSSKTTYDYVIPAALAAFCAFATWKYTLPLAAFKTEGLVPGILNLLNLLIAFFIAALAAVATFDRKGLDDPMKGEPATMLRRKKNNALVEQVLTHRQFVSYLFGFLSFSSLALLVGLTGIRVIGKDAWEKGAWLDVFGDHRAWAFFFIKEVAVFLFFFVLFQILVTTLLSLYFLSDRLQFMQDESD